MTAVCVFTCHESVSQARGRWHEHWMSEALQTYSRLSAGRGTVTFLKRWIKCKAREAFISCRNKKRKKEEETLAQL